MWEIRRRFKLNQIAGKKDNRGSARDAIVGLRSQLLMLDKKEEHLNKKIDEELKKAKSNATTNKRRTSIAHLNRRILLTNAFNSRDGCLAPEESIRGGVG